MTHSARRIAAMSGAEIRSRVASAVRNGLDRARVAIAPPRWPVGTVASHRAFAAEVTRRPTPFPLSCPDLPARVGLLQSFFPSAADDAARRADRILDGRYDLLGYRDVPVGRPPAWHVDAVHRRSAPVRFWADVPFLDPAGGDHKVIWELNRHQHLPMLGRAYQLTGDRRYYIEFVAQLESWLASNPPLVGINWASMLELAFRSLSWLWALHFFAPAAADDPDGAPPWSIDLVVALDRQLTQIERNLSHYFSPNTHLTGEALALYVCGLALPGMPASPRRVEAGRAILLREAGRQVRPDGGHAELSSHYHRYSTDFYLLAYAVARSAGDRASGGLGDAAIRQAEFLRTIADDRGRLPLIGDDDGGVLLPICGREPADCRDTLATAAVLLGRPDLAVSAAPEETFWLCGPAATALRTPARASWHSRALPDSGYFVSRTATGDYLVLDAGPHGYLGGGHAHADALSVVLTVRGRPLLVDGGTATYTMDAAVRDRLRSTAMHNTVVIGGRSQAEPDGPFRWRGTTDAHLSLSQFAERADFLEARHAAYTPFTHVRQVLAVPGVGWFFVDHVLGAGALQAQAFWHLHPDWQLDRPGAVGTWLARSRGLSVAMASSAPLALEARFSTHAPAYGVIVDAPCLAAVLPDRAPCSILTVVTAEAELFRGLSVESVPLTHQAGDCWHTSAFAIRYKGGTAFLLAAVERGGVPANMNAAPGRLWGVAGMTTDARVALASRGAGGALPSLLVNGTALHEAAAGLESSVQQRAIEQPGCVDSCVE